VWPFLLGLAAGLPAAACRPPAETSPEIALGCTVEPQPPAVGAARVLLRLTEIRTGRPVSGAAVRLEADMSHPGMEPVFSEAREAAPGRYEAPLELTMPGDWVLLVTATLRDGSTVRLRADLPGVRAALRSPVQSR
jgi:hypothetical protein